MAFMTILMCLIPKPDDGERTIGMLSMPIKLYLRALRRSIGNHWMMATAPPNWYGVRGRSVARAAWSRGVAARHFMEDEGWSTLVFLLDVTEAFDHLQWSDIWEAAQVYSFPIDLMAFLLRLYGGVRYIMLGTRMAATAIPKLSVIAGCAFADCCMLLIMLTVNRRIALATESIPNASFLTATVADDLQIMVATSKDRIGKVAADTYRTITSVYRVLLLPLSAKKLCALGGRNTSKKQWDQLPREARAARVNTARNLGYDFTLGKKRTAKVANARTKSLMGRWTRIIQRRRKGMRTAYLVPTVINAKTCWDADVNGASDTKITESRRLAHAGVVKQGANRSVTIDLATDQHIKPQKLDPAFRLMAAPIITAAKAIWEEWVPITWVYRLWIRAFKRIAILRVEKKSPCHTASDPITVLAASAERLGWTSSKALVLMTHEGVELDLRKHSPHTIKTMAYRAVEDKLLRDVARRDPLFHQYGEGSLPWLDPIRSALNDAQGPDWNQLHITLAQTRAAGGVWTAARIADMLAERGIDHDRDCAVCCVPCDLPHLTWTCCTTEPFRHHYCDGRLQLIADDAAAGRFGSITESALAPDLSRHLPPPCMSEEVHWVIPPPVGHHGFGRSGFGDGSTKALFGARSARSAFAVVQLYGWGSKLEVKMCVVGTVPLPYQDTPAAELCAFVAFLENIGDKGAKDPIEFLTDCKWVSDGFLAGEAYTIGSRMACAELWKRLWRAQKALAGKVTAIKVCAHASDNDVLEGYPQRWRDGNACADAAAKNALSLHPRDDRMEYLADLQWRTTRYLVKLLARLTKYAGKDAHHRKQEDDYESAAALQITHQEPAAEIKFLKHTPVPIGDSFRCITCHRVAYSAEALDKVPCNRDASGHLMWYAHPITMCVRCGAYSNQRTHLLHDVCRNSTDSRARKRLSRVFTHGLHPTDDTPVGTPVLWRDGNAAGTQVIFEPSGDPEEDLLVIKTMPAPPNEGWLGQLRRLARCFGIRGGENACRVLKLTR